MIVLDFWATWCGPCIQAMPQVDAAVRDFADQGVQLIAVNLEETPKKITAMLERHKLDMTVALDRDGAVAGKYAATAIPQTVIIDREGKVARVFVGGGPTFGDQVREAPRAVLEPDKKGSRQRRSENRSGHNLSLTPVRREQPARNCRSVGLGRGGLVPVRLIDSQRVRMVLFATDSTFRCSKLKDDL